MTGMLGLKLGVVRLKAASGMPGSVVSRLDHSAFMKMTLSSKSGAVEDVVGKFPPF